MDTGCRDPPQQFPDGRAGHPLGAQVLASELQQQGGCVVLEGPGEQKVVEHFQRSRGGRRPAQPVQDLPQVLGAGAVLPAAVAGQRGRVDIQLVGEPVDRGGRSGGHVVGDEAEPGQGGKLQRQPEPVARPAVLGDQPPPGVGVEAEEGGEVFGPDVARIARQLRELGVGQHSHRHGGLVPRGSRVSGTTLTRAALGCGSE